MIYIHKGVIVETTENRLLNLEADFVINTDTNEVMTYRLGFAGLLTTFNLLKYSSLDSLFEQIRLFYTDCGFGLYTYCVYPSMSPAFAVDYFMNNKEI